VKWRRASKMENYSNTEIYLAHLAKEIKAIEEEIIYDASRPNVNRFILEKKYERLKRLTGIYNGLEHEYQQFELLSGLAPRLKNFIDNKPELGIVIIRLFVHPDNTTFGIIEYNPFRND
jgi:hypothetical protein